MALILSKRINNTNWLKIHYIHCFNVNHDNINSIIVGDSIVEGLTRYSNRLKNLFGNRFINLDIHGDCIGHVLWYVRDVTFSPWLKNVVILCGTKSMVLVPPLPMILFKDWLPLVHLLKTGSITLTY